MNAQHLFPVTHRARRLASPRLLTVAALATVLTGCALASADGSATSSSARQDAAAGTATPGQARGSAPPPIVVRIGDRRVTASLADTLPARQFAAMLPLQLSLHDPMGQAKSGRLPRAIEVAGAPRVHDYEQGGIYYWPPSHTVAVIYDDLGQTVPAPGLVQLGTVTHGMAVIAAAGNDLTARVDWLPSR